MDKNELVKIPISKQTRKLLKIFIATNEIKNYDEAILAWLENKK